MDLNSGWIASGEVLDALERLTPVLLDVASAGPQRLSEMACYLAASSGKRLRPALFFIAHGPGCARHEALRAAATVELIHIASLYHDDIMDRGMRRRGMASANARWGNGPAMLAGTFLLLRAQSLAMEIGPEARRLVGSAMTALCLGQLREAENAYDAALELAAHLEVLALKTGTLFGLALQLGAMLGGADEAELCAYATYGRSLGLAFQLSDDLLDIADDAETTGKDGLADIAGGVYSLPWLLLLRAGGRDAEALRGFLDRDRLCPDGAREALALLRNTDAIHRARTYLAAEVASAVAALEPLRDKTARSSLSALARSMESRSR